MFTRIVRATCAVTICFVATTAVLATGPLPCAAGHSVYFAHVVESLKLSAAKRSQVRRIVNRSEREIRAVFAKHGINPNAKPEFGKLFSARHELQAVERNERNQLKQILSKEQLKIYDRLMQHTRAQVIKATRNDN